mmetsp:Transcript_88481/g.255251  ORF Transcript_88481/g.255251 Transcript_88481/m.255251 type:complete len:254 (+) Transcript_88481:696-1457(+)
MDASHRQIDVVQELIIELHGIARREEHHDFLVPVSLQKGEQEQEPALGGAHNVALRQPGHRSDVVLRLHLDEDGLVQGEPRQVRDLPCLRRGEERRLPLRRQHLHDHVQLLLEADLQDPVRLINGQVDEVVENEAFGVLHVIKQPAGGRNKDVHPLAQLLGLCSAVHTTHNACDRLRYILGDVPQNVVDLLCQFSRGRDHQGAHTVARQKLDIVQQVDGRHQKGQRLPAASLGRSKHVLAVQQVRDGLRLDFC